MKPTAFGIEFDSKLERDRYLVLRSMADAGEISELVARPPSVTLLEKWTDLSGKRWRAVRYTPDFTYTDDSGRVFEEVKPTSRRARSWGREVPIKLRLLAEKFPLWQVRVWTPDSDRRGK